MRSTSRTRSGAGDSSSPSAATGRSGRSRSSSSTTARARSPTRTTGRSSVRCAARPPRRCAAWSHARQPRPRERCHRGREPSDGGSNPMTMRGRVVLGLMLACSRRCQAAAAGDPGDGRAAKQQIDARIDQLRAEITAGERARRRAHVAAIRGDSAASGSTGGVDGQQARLTALERAVHRAGAARRRNGRSRERRHLPSLHAAARERRSDAARATAARALHAPRKPDTLSVLPRRRRSRSCSTTWSTRSGSAVCDRRIAYAARRARAAAVRARRGADLARRQAAARARSSKLGRRRQGGPRPTGREPRHVSPRLAA